MQIKIRRFFTAPSSRPTRPRLDSAVWPAVVYAIGDVHGHLDLLRQLEAKIAADAKDIEGEKWLVTLGDYIDRGPDSSGVIAHVMGPAPEGFKRIALVGNHEQIMLDCLAVPDIDSPWVRYGGVETLASYGMSVEDVTHTLRDRLPQAHLKFMAELPLCLTLPGYFFVHAGIRPGIALQKQAETDLIWIRGEFLEAERDGPPVVVHGHTPTPEPQVTPFRIGIDTGAFKTGILTAVKLQEGKAPVILQVGA
jgi:serine/threonine protein phosphatase 1